MKIVVDMVLRKRMMSGRGDKVFFIFKILSGESVIEVVSFEDVNIEEGKVISTEMRNKNGQVSFLLYADEPEYSFAE